MPFAPLPVCSSLPAFKLSPVVQVCLPVLSPVVCLVHVCTLLHIQELGCAFMQKVTQHELLRYMQSGRVGGARVVVSMGHLVSDNHGDQAKSLFVSCCAVDGTLTSDVYPPGFTQFSSATPSLRVQSNAFCQALFDIYLSPKSVVQDGRKRWTASALELAK